MASSRRIAMIIAMVAAIAAGLVAVATSSFAAGPPTFVQKVSGRGTGKTRTVTMPSATVAGNRLIVEVGIWNYSSSKITAVTDNAGDTFVRLLSVVAADHTR
jgi:hypothetical protein